MHTVECRRKKSKLSEGLLHTRWGAKEEDERSQSVWLASNEFLTPWSTVSKEVLAPLAALIVLTKTATNLRVILWITSDWLDKRITQEYLDNFPVRWE